MPLGDTSACPWLAAKHLLPAKVATHWLLAPLLWSWTGLATRSCGAFLLPLHEANCLFLNALPFPFGFLKTFSSY